MFRTKFGKALVNSLLIASVSGRPLYPSSLRHGTVYLRVRGLFIKMRSDHRRVKPEESKEKTVRKYLSMSIGLLSLCAALAIPLQVAAQNNNQPSRPKHHHYVVYDLGTLGGPSGTVGSEPFVNLINSAGVVVGGADISASTPEPGCYNPVNNPDCYISHAFEWRNNHLKDLGTLQGGNFSFATSIDQSGQIAGVSETNQLDPTTGNPEFHAVVWENGRIRDLGTLGGVSSFAGTINNLGQVVGVALNQIPDPYSIMGNASATTLTQSRAFLWQKGEMRDLGTLGGPDSWPNALNNHGQVAGASFTSDVVDPNSGALPVGVFLWENGEMKDLGSLGGNNSYLPPYGIVVGLNNRGEVAATMMAPGDQFQHAVIWNGKNLFDLGTLGGDSSWAYAINDPGNVVGVALGPEDATVHAFITNDGKMVDLGTAGSYECSVALGVNKTAQTVGALTSAQDGCNTWRSAFLSEMGAPMVDLNTLIPANSPLQLFAAFHITDEGEIVGGGMPPYCTDSDTCANDRVFLLVPCDENHPDVEGCDYDPVEAVTDAQVLPVLAIPTPAVSLAKVSPTDLMTRFRSLSAGHKRRYGMPQTSVTYDALSSPSSIHPSGNGTDAATTTLTPSSMTFVCAARLVGGGCTPPQKAILTNSGSSTLSVFGIKISGLYFSQTNSCPTTLKPAQSCAITVSFDGPASRAQPKKKTFTGSLSVSDTATQSPQEVFLTGITSGVP
jgi:probable HAF family extracellular repeat protein